MLSWGEKGLQGSLRAAQGGLQRAMRAMGSTSQAEGVPAQPLPPEELLEEPLAELTPSTLPTGHSPHQLGTSALLHAQFQATKKNEKG